MKEVQRGHAHSRYIRALGTLGGGVLICAACVQVFQGSETPRARHAGLLGYLTLVKA
jgi:hypothetical protein